MRHGHEGNPDDFLTLSYFLIVTRINNLSKTKLPTHSKLKLSQLNANWVGLESAIGVDRDTPALLCFQLAMEVSSIRLQKARLLSSFMML